MTATELQQHFHLQVHPEGGFYTSTYRSEEIIAAGSLSNRFSGNRHLSTAIYFLLTQDTFSAFHRIKSDEMWHFYDGGSLLIHVIYPEGRYKKMVLGNDVRNGETFQAVVPAGCWFASECAPSVPFSFVGCTVSPGFDFGDFELGNRDQLVLDFPGYTELINRLTRK